MEEESIKTIYRSRLHRLKIMTKLLQLSPFLRCVILNGSMATGKIKESSDIDILVIAKSGRIYTCRAGVLFLAHLSGLKRSSNERKSHASRFCFNYFLADKFLTIPHNRGEKMNKYCAENYSRSKLVWGDEKIFNKYMRTNLVWMMPLLRSGISNSKFLMPARSAFSTADAGGSNKISSIKLFIWIARMKEYLLSKKFGDLVERVLKNIQIKKINKDPRTKRYPELIVCSDRELRFHPPRSLQN